MLIATLMFLKFIYFTQEAVNNSNIFENIASFFNVAVGTKVWKLSRLRGLKEGPFVYFESYFHPRIGLKGTEDFTRPLYDILENDYHVIPTVSKEKIKAKSASKITADRLRIDAGEPVLVRERFVSDPGEKPIEYNIGF